MDVYPSVCRLRQLDGVVFFLGANFDVQFSRDPVRIWRNVVQHGVSCLSACVRLCYKLFVEQQRLFFFVF